MKKDQMLTRRRALIAGAAVLGAAGAAGTAHVLTADQAAKPVRSLPGSGPAAARARKPGAAPPGPRPGAPPPPQAAPLPPPADRRVRPAAPPAHPDPRPARA